MSLIPMILLTGAGKNHFIAAFAATRPAGERCGLLTVLPPATSTNTAAA